VTSTARLVWAHQDTLAEIDPQGVTLIKGNPDQTSWPQIEDCTQISY
jgi:hypothetical protein